MKTLGIDLQDGFVGDEVIITINGKEKFRSEAITTKLLLGFAETLKYQLRQGNTTITLNLPKKRLEKTIQLNLSEDTYVGISITQAGIEYSTSDQSFTYG